jgi:manganese oxidase
MNSRLIRLPVAAAGIVLVLVAAACGGTARRVAGEPTMVQVSLQEFSITPAQISVPEGDPVMLHVANAGTAQHAFAVQVGSRTYSTPLLAGGANASLNLPGLAAGTYSAWCTVPGHKEAGMTALLVAGKTTGQADGSGSSQDAGMGSMSSGMTAQQMADAHKRSTVAFPAKTGGLGGQVLEPTMDGDVKVFDLVAKAVKWEVSPGVFKEAFTYNGTVPGPQIRVQQGDKIRVILENSLPQPTVIHFHGLTVPNAMDGVPYITQDPVMPGGYFVYEFTVKDPPGTYLYHSHFNSAEQVGKGLYGAIVVEPEGTPSWDLEYTEILNDGALGFTINGKSFPATEPLTAKLGQDIRVRLSNVGDMIHPLHLHGYHFTVVEQDGQAIAQPYTVDTLMIAPGNTFDIMVKADQPGVWAFHCHILSHVEGPEGMFGMVTALIVS